LPPTIANGIRRPNGCGSTIRSIVYTERPGNHISSFLPSNSSPLSAGSSQPTHKRALEPITSPTRTSLPLCPRCSILENEKVSHDPGCDLAMSARCTASETSSLSKSNRSNDQSCSRKWGSMPQVGVLLWGHLDAARRYSPRLWRKESSELHQCEGPEL